LALHGEKTYNGVAILAKFPLSDITRGLPGDEEHTHARYIEAVVNLGKRQEAGGKSGVDDSSSLMPLASGLLPAALRVASVYVPNGQDIASSKYAMKLRFLDRLKEHMHTLMGYEEMLAIGGDYNVAPYAVDVHNPQAWENTVL